MLELLMLSLCFGSEMSSDACSAAYMKWLSESPEVTDQMKFYEHSYEKRLPPELIWAGSAVSFIYKRQVRFGATRNIYLDIRDQGYGGVGFKKSFP